MRQGNAIGVSCPKGTHLALEQLLSNLLIAGYGPGGR